MSQDPQLIELINKTPFLSQGDKNFLIDKLPQLSALEKLKLRQSLSAGMAPPILQQLQLMRAKFFEKEAPKAPDPITKVLNNIMPQKPKKILNTSILTQPNLLGGPIPQAIRGEKAVEFRSLAEFSSPAQLGLLNSSHVSFNINDNVEQIIQNFLQKLTQMFNQIDNVNLRRSYFMNFVQSPLFSSYLNTGLTALRHPELEPSKIILNLLYQIDPHYLNTKQFQHTSVICHHLRTLCGI
jgi:hypothetical protein